MNTPNKETNEEAPGQKIDEEAIETLVHHPEVHALVTLVISSIKSANSTLDVLERYIGVEIDSLDAFKEAARRYPDDMDDTEEVGAGQINRDALRQALKEDARPAEDFARRVERYRNSDKNYFEDPVGGDA